MQKSALSSFNTFERYFQSLNLYSLRLDFSFFCSENPYFSNRRLPSGFCEPEAAVIAHKRFGQHPFGFASASSVTLGVSILKGSDIFIYLSLSV